MEAIEIVVKRDVDGKWIIMAHGDEMSISETLTDMEKEEVQKMLDALFTKDTVTLKEDF